MANLLRQGGRRVQTENHLPSFNQKQLLPGPLASGAGDRCLPSVNNGERMPKERDWYKKPLGQGVTDRGAAAVLGENISA